MNQILRRKKTLFRCIAFSLLIHLLCAFLLQRNPIWLYPPRPNPTSPSSEWLACMSKEEKTLILKASFLRGSVHTEFFEKSLEPTSEKGQIALRMNVSDPSHLPSQLPLTTYTSFHPNHLLVSNTETISEFTLPEEEPLHLPSYIPKDLLSLPVENPPITYIAPPAFYPEETIAIAPVPPKLELTVKLPEVTPWESTDLVSFFSLEKPTPPPKLHPKLFNSLPQLPTLEELETSTYSEEFDTDLVFMPLEDKPGYLFALTLIPRKNLQISKMKQHYMFLIDRANSIQKERLIETKIAILKALDELNPQDTFNLIVFDSKMEKFSVGQMSANKGSIAKAKEFLQKIELGSFFSPADLYKPLLMTVPYHVQEDEIYTAIVLTDGDSLSKKNALHSLFNQWTAYNQGKVTLYVVGMRGDKYLDSFDAICALNRGQCIETNTKKALRRRLLKLIKTIEAPIVKNIACQAFSRAPNAHVAIYPENTRTQHLYANQPYVLVGTADTLDDFILFIQGRIKDRWLNIKKTISFISARKGDISLKNQWALQKAYTVYQTYLKDKNPNHLSEIKTLIDPLELPAVF